MKHKGARCEARDIALPCISQSLLFAIMATAFELLGMQTLGNTGLPVLAAISVGVLGTQVRG